MYQYVVDCVISNSRPIKNSSITTEPPIICAKDRAMVVMVGAVRSETLPEEPSLEVSPRESAEETYNRP